MPPKGTKKEVKEPAKTPQVSSTLNRALRCDMSDTSLLLTSQQKTKVDAKVEATPSKKSKQTTKEESTAATPRKAKELPKLTKLARDKTATLPVTVTFQGDNVEAKHVKAGYSHALKLDASAPFTLLDSVSQ
jgi:hypothetical protein